MFKQLDNWKLQLPFSKSSCSHLYGVFLILAIMTAVAVTQGEDY